MALDGTQVLQDVYDSEINLTLGWFWDGGINLVIGDDMNGVRHADHFDTMEGLVIWLTQELPRLYPDSEFAKKWHQ